MGVLLTRKHVRFISLALGLVVFLIVVLLLPPGCAGVPAAWAPGLEQEAAHPPLGQAARDPDAVGR